MRAESKVRGFARYIGLGNSRATNGAHSPTEGVDAVVEERPAPPFGAEPSAGALWAKLVWALAVTVVTAALAVAVYGFGSEAGIKTPLAREDNFFYGSIVQSVIQEGWYERSDRLGAPHGQQLFDFPMGDNVLHFVVLKVLIALTENPLAVINLHIIVAFALIAGLAYLCLRSVGVEHWPAAVASILFAFLPFHFARATYHTFLQAYWEVPLVLPLLKWATGGRLLRRPVLEWLLVAVIAVVVATTGVYYAAFLIVLLVAGAGIELIRTRRPWPIVRALGVSAVIGVVLVASFWPAVTFQRREGVNHELAQRVPLEAEQFGLRPSILLLPSPYHRIDKFAEIGQRAQDVQEPSEGPISLGVVAGLGLLLAIGFALMRAVRNGGLAPASGYMAALSIVAILVAAKGGLSFAMALFGTKQLRTWSRMSVFIGLFALTFLALRVPAMRARLGKPATLAIVAAVLVVGLVDQVPGHPNPRKGELAPEIAADRAFTLAMEQALPQGAMVYQWPVVRFPEEPSPGIASGYDDLRFHILGTGKLRYSFGGIKGREQQWQERWADNGPGASAVAAAATGFSAVVFDRFGYKKATDVQWFESQFVHLLGPPVSDQSWRNRYAWFDLRPLRQRLEDAQPGQIDALGQVAANPPFLRWNGGGQAWANIFPVTRDLQPYATAEVSSPAPRPVRFEGRLNVPEGVEGRVRFEGAELVRLPEGENRIDIPLVLERPETRLEFEFIDLTTGQRMQNKVAVAVGLHLVDPAADPLLDLSRTWLEQPPAA